METAVALSRASEGGFAAAEAADAVGTRVGVGCDLVVVFATPDHSEALESMAAVVEARLEPEVVLGAIAQGVVGAGCEVESGPAVAVFAANLAGLQPRGFRAWTVRTEQGGVAVAGWPDPAPEEVTLVCADPYSFPIAEVVDRIDRAVPGHRIVGGLLTGGPGRSRFLLDGHVYDDGAVGVTLPGQVVDLVVSHGCRPVGNPLTVTRAHGDHLLELAGEPATAQLQRLLDEVDEQDRELMRTAGLQVGLVAAAHRDDYRIGDFLVRGVLSIDADRGAIRVGEHVEVGQVVQFHVRDAGSASADLASRLAGAGPAAGGLLFTCNGRGRRLFATDDHDVARVEMELGVPVAGVFCAGEVGPVGERNALHGFTASVLVLHGPDREVAGPEGGGAPPSDESTGWGAA